MIDDVGATIGVEEEFHIVDPTTGAVVPEAGRVLQAGDTEAEPELHRGIVETATSVHTGLDDLRRDLVARRRELAGAADRVGLAVVTSGTVPDAGNRIDRVFPKPRYEWMAEEYRQLVHEQQVCACQVHVGVADRDLAVRITRRIRTWLPTLLAMTASSPYFRSADSGYASYRTIVVSRWPTVGPPPDFASADQYDRTVQILVDSGVISDAGMIYFDARLSARYPTIEIRVADACPTVDDAVLLAALSRALVITAARHDLAPPDGHMGHAVVPTRPQVLLRAASWRAARSGLDGHLIDPWTIRAAPAAEIVRALLDHVRPVLDERGEWPVVSELTAALLSRGTSAKRQRVQREGADDDAAVVRSLIAETVAP